MGSPLPGDPTPLPWLYRFAEEQESRRGQHPLRPVVLVSMAAEETLPIQVGLVDSGSEHVLAPAWIARSIGIDLSRVDDRLLLGIGGQAIEARFAELTLRLHAPDSPRATSIEWRADVGFVPRWDPPFSVLLGQVGFLDTFTVTMSRMAGTLAIEDPEVFDERFGAHTV